MFGPNKINWRRLVAEAAAIALGLPDVVVSSMTTVSRSAYDALVSSGRVGLLSDGQFVGQMAHMGTLQEIARDEVTPLAVHYEERPYSQARR